MHRTRTWISLLLAGLLTLPLAACGEAAEPSPAEPAVSAAESAAEAEEDVSEPEAEAPEEATEAADAEAEETEAVSSAGETEDKLSEEAAEEEIAAEDERFTTGTVDGQTFTQDFFGFQMTLDDGWYFYSEEEKNELNNIVVDNITIEAAKEAIDNGASYLDMYAENLDTYEDINTYITKLSMMDALAVRFHIDTAIDGMLPTLVSQLEAIGYTDVTAEKSTTDFLGESVRCVNTFGYLDADGTSVPMYQKQVYLQEGTYLLSVTATSYFEDTTQTILDACTAY